MYIGDGVFSSPVLGALRAAYPQAQIEMVVDSRTAPVLEHHPALNRLWVFNKAAGDYKFWPYLKKLSTLRQTRYDAVINLHPNERASLLAVLARAKRRVGACARWFERWFNPPLVIDETCHQVEAYLKLLAPLGIALPAKPALEVCPAPQNKEALPPEVKEALAPLVKPPLIGLNLGGSWPTKRWPPAYYAQLAQMLIAQGFRVVLLGGPMDLPLSKACLEAMEADTRQAVLVWTGQLSLGQLLWVFGSLHTLISGDSGPLHMAASQGCATVALFGPSNPVRFRPYAANGKVLQATGLDCLGCGLHQCPLLGSNHHACLQQVHPNQVLAAVLAPPASVSGPQSEESLSLLGVV